MWEGQMNERGHMNDLCLDVLIKCKWICEKMAVNVGNGLNWLRTRSNGGLL
jgi:hypothetical protein